MGYGEAPTDAAEHPMLQVCRERSNFHEDDSLLKSHQALFSRGIVFGNSLIAAPLKRNRKSRFEIMDVVFIGETT